MDINNYIKILSEKIDQRSLNERILILIASLVVVYFLWQICVFDNISKLTQKISGSASKIQKQISTLQGQITQVSSALVNDPVVKLQQQVKAMEEENNDLQMKLNNMTDTLISPQAMTPLLKNILNNTSLKIISLKNLPPLPVVNEINNEEQKKEEENNTSKFKVYKHAVELILIGSYFQTIDFIKLIEQLPNKFFWEELEFVSMEYPKAKIRIIVGSLSVSTTLLSTS